MSDPKTTPVARMQAEGRNPGDGGETGAPDSAALHPGYGEELTALPLSELVDLVVDKIAGQKPDDMPYVGLEHITKESPWLRGWGNSKDSISTNGVFRRGDILFGKLRPNLRKSVQAPFDGFSSTDILILRPKDGFDSRFVGKVFQLDHVFREAEKTSIGTGMPRTNWRAFKQLRVFTPCAEEQRRIAEILDTLDNAIQKTEQLIAKLKQIKQGLLHDLLTRGIDENGQLRDPIAHPEQFKDSVLGRIPKDWKIVSLQLTALPGKENFVDGDWIEAPWITDSGIRLIQTGNIGEGQFLDKPEFRKYISKRSFRELGCRWVHPGDILICRLAEPIGRACEVPAQVGPSVTAVDCTIYRPNEKIAVKRFMLHLMNSKAHLRALVNIAGGSTRQRISRGNLGLASVRIPRTDEQERIVSVLDAHQAKIDAEYANKDKYRELKKGLTHDLLTGKARVVPDIMKETVQ